MQHAEATHSHRSTVWRTQMHVCVQAICEVQDRLSSWETYYQSPFCCTLSDLGPTLKHPKDERIDNVTHVM